MARPRAFETYCRPADGAGRGRGALAAALLAASTWGARDARAAPPPRGDVCAYDCEVGDVECEERRAACRRKALDGSGAGSFEERSSTDPKKTGEVDLRGKSASQTDAYVADTQELIDLITATLKLDPFDERRPKDIETIRTLANIWTGRYAPGGSYSLASAGKMYQVIDTLTGWWNFNGLRPVSASIVKDVNTQLADAVKLLNQRK
eukprot:PRCOL_00001370-RA